MHGNFASIRRLASALRANLEKCASDPDVDAVHDTRTGSRRLQATLENLVRELPEDAAGQPARDAAAALLRLMKKIRRAAGPVRDLDVHRKLLEKLTEKALGRTKEKDPGAGDQKQEASAPDAWLEVQPDALEALAAGLRVAGMDQSADALDAWLRHRRDELADGLQSQAAGFPAKLDKRLARLEQALPAHAHRRREKPPAVLALDSFARLATEMQLLDAGNLHDFRKGAKKARYVAELAAQSDAFAHQIGKTLKKLQDEIGDWHDWLVLADEARTALDGETGRHDSGTPDLGAVELIARIEQKREEHFIAAMKTAAKLRGPLMGEWLASSRKPVRSISRSRASRPRKTAAD